MNDDDPRHGTPRGYSAHARADTEPCTPCREAAAAYERQRFYDAHLGRQRRIDVTGSRRRIRALQAIGWTTQRITAELGYTHRDALAAMIYDAEWITRSRAKKIAEVYDRLSMTPGPSNITRTRALRAGFAPPLAWDDSTIDDPDAEPHGMGRDIRDEAALDTAVVERVLSGEKRTSRLTNAEAAEIVRRALARGQSTYDIERLYGLKSDRYTRGAA